MCERDLVDGNLLRVESAQDFEERRAAIRGVGAHALVEDRCTTHTGDRPCDIETTGPALCERLVASDPDRDDVRADRGLQLRGTPFADNLAQVDDRGSLAALVRLFHGLSRVADDAPDVQPIALDIEARDADGAARLREERCDNPDDGRLPGPVRPEETEELARAHGEADVVDGLDLLLAAAPVHLHQVTDIDDGILR